MMQETKPYSDYLIDLRFQGVNRLFILSFENNGHRTGYWQCFLPTVEIKGYNIMIDGRNFFDQPVKSNLRTFERSKLFKEVITQGCLLDYCYFNKYYKTIAIQQISFTGNLAGDPNTSTSLSFIIEGAKKTFQIFLQGTVKFVLL